MINVLNFILCYHFFSFSSLFGLCHNTLYFTSLTTFNAWPVYVRFVKIGLNVSRVNILHWKGQHRKAKLPSE